MPKSYPPKNHSGVNMTRTPKKHVEIVSTVRRLQINQETVPKTTRKITNERSFKRYQFDVYVAGPGPVWENKLMTSTVLVQKGKIEKIFFILALESNRIIHIGTRKLSSVDWRINCSILELDILDEDSVATASCSTALDLGDVT
jgi:hypothetical protein